MFRVATFNAGLAVGYLPYVTERLPAVVDAVARFDADLLYVQEFWLDAHWDALRAAAASNFPHVLRPTPVAAIARGACSEAQLAPLVACAQRHCAGLRDEALAACVVRSCASQGLALGPDCLNCIAADVSGSIEDIVARCVGAAGTSSAAPDRRGSRYSGLVAYGGSFGTGFLSRTPLRDRDELVYAASVNARGAIYAHVELGTSGPVHVFGTHFSPGGAEQGPQVEALLAWIERKVPRTAQQPIVLLGDLNLSPGSALYRSILRAGFREPDAPDTRGTFGNGLGTGDVSDSGWRIDHVLVRDVATRVRSRRVFDQPVRLGGSLVTTLSDHFGVCAIVE